MTDRFIVAEISKNWIAGEELEPGLLCQRFEAILNVNAARGYRLLSFQVHRLMIGDALNETLLAVFEREEAAPEPVPAA